MSLVIGALQLLFSLTFGLMLLLWLVSFAAAWAWAQNRAFETQTNVSLSEVLSVASIEWGAFIVLLFYQILPKENYYEAPPIDPLESPMTHRPVVFIPSLHLHSGLFRILKWRLIKHHYKSLWIFDWPIFLKDSVFLERELVEFLKSIIQRTQSPDISIISFGSSRPIIGRCLVHSDISKIQIRWLAVSAPQKNCPALHFFATQRWRSSLARQSAPYRDPDELIVGERDTLCYPESVFESPITTLVKDVGHYGTLLHSTTTQNVLDFLSRK